MPRFLHVTLVVITFWLVPGADAHSAPANGQNFFKAGIEAFNRGDLQQARDYLEAADGLGLDSKALTYNLGVVYFQLKQYDKAAATFQRLMGSRQEALAFYNIGLVALAQQDLPRADRAFQRVLMANPEPKLETLARTQLKRLDVKLAEPRPPQRWIGLASVNAGYEDNIALFPDSAATAIEGGFLESVGAVSGLIYGSRKAGFRQDVKLYARHYPADSDFDTQIIQAETGWVQQTGFGRIHAGLGGDYIWLGGKTREGRARLVFGLKRQDCLGLANSERCRVEGEVKQIYPQPEWEAYRGQQYQVDARYQASASGWTGSLRYRVVYDDRKNLDTGREYFSVSPLRQGVKAKLEFAVTPQLTLTSAAEVRYSYYRTPHRLQVPDGVLIIRREDTRYDLSLGASYAVSKTVAMLIEANQADNDSNIERYQYGRHSVTAGVTVRF
ncbi:tetratricopeptide repeat protein [Marinobacter caseinilyticus]|uniref:tetratricopeptide repeat protein n=1 Tax=Marinobacter caseinilyticus TaxID=2692195 RepID=UPI001408A0A3|nr:tetratricopeptide repeat protein [Marinobacter caseinilyticus]